jgi:hypothetical protein
MPGLPSRGPHFNCHWRGRASSSIKRRNILGGLSWSTCTIPTIWSFPLSGPSPLGFVEPVLGPSAPHKPNLSQSQSIKKSILPLFALLEKNRDRIPFSKHFHTAGLGQEHTCMLVIITRKTNIVSFWRRRRHKIQRTSVRPSYTRVWCSEHFYMHFSGKMHELILCLVHQEAPPSFKLQTVARLSRSLYILSWLSLASLFSQKKINNFFLKIEIPQKKLGLPNWPSPSHLPCEKFLTSFRAVTRELIRLEGIEGEIKKSRRKWTNSSLNPLQSL